MQSSLPGALQLLASLVGVLAFGAADGGQAGLWEAGELQTGDEGVGILPRMLHVLLCIFLRMLPGMSRALQLILAENDLPAGGTDNQDAGAEAEGTSLPLGCGAHRPARADPQDCQWTDGLLRRPRNPTGLCPGLSGALECEAQEPGPHGVWITVRAGQGSDHRGPMMGPGLPTGRAVLRVGPQNPHWPVYLFLGVWGAAAQPMSLSQGHRGIVVE